MSATAVLLLFVLASPVHSLHGQAPAAVVVAMDRANARRGEGAAVHACAAGRSFDDDKTAFDLTAKVKQALLAVLNPVEQLVEEYEAEKELWAQITTLCKDVIAASVKVVHKGPQEIL